MVENACQLKMFSIDYRLKKKKKLIEQQPYISFFFKSGKHMTGCNKVLMFETRLVLGAKHRVGPAHMPCQELI